MPKIASTLESEISRLAKREELCLCLEASRIDMSAYRVLGIYFATIVALGTLGFVAHVGVDQFMFHNIPADWPAVWVSALVVTAAFVVLVCTPVQLLARRMPMPASALFGLLCGPLTLWLGQLLKGKPLSMPNYIATPGGLVLSCTLAALGLLFALIFRRMYRA